MLPTALARALFLVVLLAVAANLRAQELPGTPTGEPPPPLRSPYGEREAPTAKPPVSVPGRPPVKRPLFTLVPDLRLGFGYSDNIFITPDVLGTRPVSDGLFSVAPRLRGLLRLGGALGLVADWSFNFQEFFSHGDSTVNSGQLFLGYRPVLDRHVELGLRGGLARVSEFPLSDANEGHVFLSGTYGIVKGTAISASSSVGLRDFPRRSRSQTEASTLDLGPLQIVLPPSTTIVHRGQQDVITNVTGGLSQALVTGMGLQLAYDFTNNNSEFSNLDFQTHRTTVGATATAWRWLSARLAYSANFRRFENLTVTTDSTSLREDVIHSLSLRWTLTPRFLSGWPLTRLGSLQLGYDRLMNRSNAQQAEFDRNYVSATLEIGFRPL